VTSESAVAAVSCNRDVSNKEPSPLQDCRDVVHIAIFFDGTGNNGELDSGTKSWSNVARMYQVALKQPSKSIFAVYVSGIGTKSNAKAANWIYSANAWLEDNEVVGGASGAGGARRLIQGRDNVNDRLRQVLIAGARQLTKETKDYAAAATDKSFGEVNDVLGRFRLIKMINHSFFGFSRGAALARAYSNRVIRKCKREGSELRYEGYPIRLNFLGVFDTVASFGVPAKNVRLPFEERELVVSPIVERCVHYIAANEVRFAFPVDLIRKKGKLAGEWVENVYPGVHSDIGGGYEPLAQGINNNFARIAMRDMMSESVTSGVRIMSYEEVEKVNEPLFIERFKIHDATLKAYSSYKAAYGDTSGTVESQIKRHMHLFYSANGTMHRKGASTPGIDSATLVLSNISIFSPKEWLGKSRNTELRRKPESGCVMVCHQCMHMRNILSQKSGKYLRGTSLPVIVLLILLHVMSTIPKSISFSMRSLLATLGHAVYKNQRSTLQLNGVTG